jgi:hypothetical protein
MKTLNLLFNRKWFWITILTVAFGMVESAVVIYLRELYYPKGFQFPLQITSNLIAVTEVFREAATILMLAAIGMLAGKNPPERFAWFIYSFAIWDISYYLFLYLLTGWPVSLSEWDILFLIPIIWAGPVWAPLLLSVLMILLAFCIRFSSGQNLSAGIKLREWIFLFSGALIVIVAFCTDYFIFITSHHRNIAKTQLFFSKEAIGYAAQYVPGSFDRILFLFGSLLISIGIVLYAARNMIISKNQNQV